MTNLSNNISRDKILTAVRNVEQRTVVVSETYRPVEVYFTPDELLSIFKTEVESVAGQCFVFLNEKEMVDAIATLVSDRKWEYLVTGDNIIAQQLKAAGIKVQTAQEDLTSMPAAITPCEALVARTGSVVMSSCPELGRQLYAFAPVHLVVASHDQLVAFPEDALMLLKKKYPQGLPAAVSFVTGPSRTADIEKTLVLGAHGPKELIIFVLKS